MREVLVIGIGAGDPDHVTVQAVKALNRVDVFFVLGKGPATAGLARLRREVCARHIAHDRYRIVEAADPPRDRRPADGAAYEGAVDDWHERRADVVESLIDDELGEDGCGAFLAWGDPSLYDSTLRVLDRVAGRGATPFRVEVIPGVGAVQALTARHRIPLNRVAAPVLLTTGRRLADEGVPDGVDDVVVLLDGVAAYERLLGDGTGAAFDIWWGANVGTPDEVVVAGPLVDVAEQVAAARAHAKEAAGWVMDTYLLRRRRPDDDVA